YCCNGSVYLAALHSFPTRRSSDLGPDSPVGCGDVAVARRAPRHAATPTATRPEIARRAAVICVEEEPSDLDLWTRSPSLRHDRADRKSTRLNSSHVSISYAVFCLK